MLSDNPKDEFYQRILFGTPGYLGVDIDSKYILCVFCIGLSTSILDFIQELGRCGRHEDSNKKDLFFFTFTLIEYVYLH